MRFTERLFDNLEDGEVFGFSVLIGAIPTIIGLVIYMGEVADPLSDVKGLSTVFWIIMGLYWIVKMILTFVLMGVINVFLLTSVQQVLSKKQKKPTNFTIQELYERIFKRGASMVSVIISGYIISVYLQSNMLRDVTDGTNEWLIVGKFLAYFIIAFAIAFFLQSIVISVHFIATHFIGTFSQYMNQKEQVQMKKGAVRNFLQKLKKEAKEPVVLLLSFVVIPLILVLLSFASSTSSSSFFAQSIDIMKLTVQVLVVSIGGYIVMSTLNTIKKLNWQKKSGQKEMFNTLEQIREVQETVTESKQRQNQQNQPFNQVDEQEIKNVLSTVHSWIKKIHPHVDILSVENQHAFEKAIQRDYPVLLDSYQSVPKNERKKVKETTLKSLNEINTRLSIVYDEVVAHYITEHERISNRIQA